MFEITKTGPDAIDCYTYQCFCPFCEWRVQNMAAAELIGYAKIDADKFIRNQLEETMYRHLEDDHDLWRKERAVLENDLLWRKNGYSLTHRSELDGR